MPPPQRVHAGWVRADDAEQYDTARELNVRLPLWWVYWSPYRRCYWALCLGPAHVDPIKATTAQALYDQARTEQLRAQAPPRLFHRGGPEPSWE